MTSTVRVASFNLFWFGTNHPRRAPRGPHDLDLVERVLGRLDAQVLAFQEVVDLKKLTRVLGDRWRCIDGASEPVCSPDVEPVGAEERLKLVVAWQDDVLEFVGTERVSLGQGAHFRGRRPPLVAHLRHRASGWPITVVTVHLKAGPHSEPGGPEARTRDQECRRVATWLEPQGQDNVVLLGDLNASIDHSSVRALRGEQLDGWHWVPPRAETESWTTWRERLTIDHIVLSPAAARRLVGSPRIYSFDSDPELDDDHAGLHYFRRVDGHFAEPGRDAPFQAVENLYRVSDHRPVYVDLRAS